MKTVVVSIQNGLLSEMVATALNETGEYTSFRCPFDKKSSVVPHCRHVVADMLLMEMSYNMGANFEARMKEIGEVKRNLPDCKIVLLCDENSTPDLAHKIVQLKKDGVVDGFFYSSVGVKYLTAALSAF